MSDIGGEMFWVLVAVVGVVSLGGALALSLVREREPTEDEIRAAQEGGRSRSYEGARDGAR